MKPDSATHPAWPPVARQRAGDAGGRRARTWRYARDGAADQGAAGIRQEAGDAVRTSGQPDGDDLSGIPHRAGTRPKDRCVTTMDRRRGWPRQPVRADRRGAKLSAACGVIRPMTQARHLVCGLWAGQDREDGRQRRRRGAIDPDVQVRNRRKAVRDADPGQGLVGQRRHAQPASAQAGDRRLPRSRNGPTRASASERRD